jgi:hypothetical protein|tara:strand:+ start:874 stop:1533 length:660 start_codon:yes stop_codon:yes gene_type:complete
MSSSSSLSAARRRRAGGQQPVSNSLPEPPKPHQSSPRPSGNAPAPNPYMLLQQHHVKINELEKKMNEISSRKNTESTSTSTNVSSDAINSQIDVTKFSDMIINKIESQLDLKAFYENDTRLAGEMEELNKIVQSQQLLINEMNSTLFHVIQQLHLQEPIGIDPTEETLEAADILVNMKRNVTFETSEMEYTGIEDEDNLSNYEGAIDASSNVVDVSNNV